VTAPAPIDAQSAGVCAAGRAAQGHSSPLRRHVGFDKSEFATYDFGKRACRRGPVRGGTKPPFCRGGTVVLLFSTRGMSDLAIIYTLGIAAVLFMVCLSFAAFVLKTACRAVGVDEPDTGLAMVVSFLEMVACGVCYGLALLTVALVGTAAYWDQTTMTYFGGFCIITLAFVVPAGLYVPMLRVSFPRGLAIAVLRYVITLAIYFGVAYVYVAVMGTPRVFR
jgi:hypothetical protein